MIKFYKAIVENGAIRLLDPIDLLEEGKVYQIEILSEEQSAQYREKFNVDADKDNTRIILIHV